MCGELGSQSCSPPPYPHPQLLPGPQTWRAWLQGGRVQQASSRLLSSEGRVRVLLPLSLHSLRSGSNVQDYFLTGYVWSAVTPSPEHLGDEVNLKVTVLCDSLQEPLTFTCNCKLEGGEGPPRGGVGSLGLSSLPIAWLRAALGGWLWGRLFRSRATSSSPKLLYLVGDGAGSCLAGNGGSGWVLSQPHLP